MNWTNFDKLRAHLVGLLQTPEQFDYRRCSLTAFDVHGCGCVSLHAHIKLGAKHCGTPTVAGPEVLQEFLGCDAHESRRIFVAQGAGSYSTPRGTEGINAALCVLDSVASNYVRPELVAPFIGDEHAFLASVKALIGQPMVEAES